MRYTIEQLSLKKAEITESLGLSRPPVNLTPKQTAEILSTSVNTLSVWRSAGRYNLPYVKISRRIAYPINAVAEFLLRRTIEHTGESTQ